MNQRVLRGCLLLIIAVLTTSNASAASRIFKLHLHNLDMTRSVDFKVNNGWYNCYEGTPGRGQWVGRAAPNGKVTMTIARVQGNGCDGEQGKFAIEVGNQGIVYFNFSNGGGLGLTKRPGNYVGTLSHKSGYDESYTWYTKRKNRAITASKASAKWVPLCEAICNESVSTTVTVGNSKEAVKSRETKKAISVTLEAGVNFPGGVGSASTSLTASEERTVGRSFSQAMSTENSTTSQRNVVYTPQEMIDLNIFAVWQWVAETRLSNGQKARVSTNKYACTPTAAKPKFLPASREHVASCRQEKKKELSALEATELEIAKLKLAKLRREMAADQNKGNGTQKPVPKPINTQPSGGLVPGSVNPVRQPTPAGTTGNGTSLQTALTFKGDRIGVTSVSYSPDGRYIINGGWENTLKYWDVRTGKPVSSINLNGKGDLLLDVGFNPAGNRIVTGSRDYDSRMHTVNVFDVGSGQPAFALDQMPPDICDDASFSPNGQLIVSGCFDGKSGDRRVQLWNASNGRTTHVLKGVNGPASFSADSSLVTGGDGARNTLKLFNTRTGQLHASVTGFGFNVVKFSPNNNNVIAGGGYKGALKVFVVSRNEAEVNYQGHTDTINGIAFSPNGQLLVSGSKDRSVRLWDTGSGRQLGVFMTPGEVESVAFSPNGKQVVSGGMGGTINVLNIMR